MVWGPPLPCGCNLVINQSEPDWCPAWRRQEISTDGGGVSGPGRGGGGGGGDWLWLLLPRPLTEAALTYVWNNTVTRYGHWWLLRPSLCTSLSQWGIFVIGEACGWRNPRINPCRVFTTRIYYGWIVRTPLKGEVVLFQYAKRILLKIMDLGAQEEFTDNFWCFWKMRCSTLYFSASEM